MRSLDIHKRVPFQYKTVELSLEIYVVLLMFKNIQHS